MFDGDADHYSPRQIRVRLSLDDYRVLNNLCTISNFDGCYGSVRSCETSDEVFSLECNKADVIIQLHLSTIINRMHVNEIYNFRLDTPGLEDPNGRPSQLFSSSTLEYYVSF